MTDDEQRMQEYLSDIRMGFVADMGTARYDRVDDEERLTFRKEGALDRIGKLFDAIRRGQFGVPYDGPTSTELEATYRV